MTTTKPTNLPKCPQCGEDATYQTPDGTFWDSNAHYWQLATKPSAIDKSAHICSKCDHPQFWEGQHSSKDPCTYYVERLAAECGCTGKPELTTTTKPSSAIDESVEQIAERLLPCYPFETGPNSTTYIACNSNQHKPYCPASFRADVAAALQAERETTREIAKEFEDIAAEMDAELAERAQRITELEAQVRAERERALEEAFKQSANIAASVKTNRCGCPHCESTADEILSLINGQYLAASVRRALAQKGGDK